jgi:hypothetical protein
MSQLTQRKAGRSDNNEGEETTYFDASRPQESGQCLSIGILGRRHDFGNVQRFTADVSTRGNKSPALICAEPCLCLQISVGFANSGFPRTEG